MLDSKPVRNICGVSRLRLFQMDNDWLVESEWAEWRIVQIKKKKEKKTWKKRQIKAKYDAFSNLHKKG